MAPPAALWPAIKRRRMLALIASSVVLASAVLGALPFRAGARSSPAPIQLQKVASASWRPDLGQPLFIAVLGTDTRLGPPDGGGGRCDAVHIISINPKTRSGTILNFPRDSYVEIPGHGVDKINSACSLGGPDLMIQTLKKLTQIPIQYYVITEFSHFVRFIDELGGILVDVPYKMKDSFSGADFPAGPVPMTGALALAFSRNRHDTPNGDFSRTENQGRLIQAGLSKFRSDSVNPHRIAQFIGAARRNIKTFIPLIDMVKLGLLATEIDPSKVANIDVPGSAGMAGSASVVFLAPGDIFDRVRDDGIF